MELIILISIGIDQMELTSAIYISIVTNIQTKQIWLSG